MAAGTDPFASYLKRADELFEAGDIVQAGQIWQAILKKKPDHETARAGLYKVKLYFDARATQGGLVGVKPPAPAPAAVEAPKPADTEITRLLEQGCTLYDAGHIEDAITKWVQVLAKEPENVLAKGYISGAQRVLEQSGAVRPEPIPSPIAVAASVPKAPEPVPVHAEPEVDVERLLRDGCTLFDMGQVEDALRKWEEILAHDPGHALARAYVQDARKDLGLPPLEEGARPAAVSQNPVEAPSVSALQETAGDERLEALIRDGVQLYDMGMVQEAKQKWQQVLDQAPGHRDAEAYLAMAIRDQHAPPPSAPKAAPAASEMSGRDFPGLQPRASFASVPVSQAPLELDLAPEAEEVPGPVQETPKAVTPPLALSSGQQKPRKGFNLQEALSGLSLPSWVASPAFILGTITGLVVLVVGTFYYMQHRKDKALRQAVEAFRATAVAPVKRGSEVKNLGETPEALRTAAQSAIGADPLMAYFHAQELARLVPADAAVAELLNRAKAGLATVDEKPATFADFERQFKNGELEAAEHSATYLLSQTPDDPILRERTARLYLALAQAYAGGERWADAEDRLRRGQALFPSDRSWSAKIVLLGRIQSMVKSERTPWIQLLG